MRRYDCLVARSLELVCFIVNSSRGEVKLDTIAAIENEESYGTPKILFESYVVK